MKVYLLQDCTCGSKIGKIIQGSIHKKLICSDCNKFIKFVGKDEYYVKVPEDEDKELQKKIDEMNVKFDIILEELKNIKKIISSLS